MLSKQKLEIAKVLRPSKLESHALTSQPRMLKISKNQPPITQLHMLKKLSIRCSKTSANYKQVNFACSKLQIIKPQKALIFH